MGNVSDVVKTYGLLQRQKSNLFGEADYQNADKRRRLCRSSLELGQASRLVPLA